MAEITWINAQGEQRIPAGKFTFTLTSGFEPGTGHLQLGSGQISQLEEKGEVEITVNFEGGPPPTTIIIKDIYVDSYTRKTDEKGNSIYTAHLKDRRFLWERYGEITLFANFIRPDGTYERGSLHGGRTYTWKEIVFLCVQAMGETENLLNPAGLPENPYLPTNIEWHSKNPAHALREMLKVAGYTVALHYDGKLSIVKINEDTPQTVPSGYGPTKETGKLFADAADSVVVVGGPTINQVSIDLEPCAFDTADGKIKGIAEVSYLQGKDVGMELATNFASLAKEPEAQTAARQTVGHLWRIPNTGFFSDDKSNVNRLLLPVLDETCEKAGQGEFLTPKLSGAYFQKETKSQYQNFGGEGEKRILFPKGWAVIDRRRGLVKTGKVSGVLTNTEIDALPVKQNGESAKVTLVPVSLTFAHYLRSANGSVNVWRYKHSDGEKIFVVRRPDMRIRLIDGKPVQPLYSQTLQRSMEIASSILSRQKEAAVEFGTYAGMQPLRHSGTIKSITWTADSASGYTHYTYDREPRAESREPKAESLASPAFQCGAQAEIHPTDEELRIINVNKRGPILIRRSQELKEKLAQDKRRDDTEGNLFAELSNFDEEHQEPELTNIGPAEELNWNYREHAQSPNPEPDAQDAVWAVQLISDDKYAIETPLNRSTELLRLCDENKGDADDIWRVRAIPGAEDVAADLPQRDSETRVRIVSKEELYRIMWLINTIIGGEGGWITDVPPEGLALTARSDEKLVSPPRRIGQIGNIVILTADDEICITKDKDTFTYANIRHDAHFHKNADKDGRIYFVDAEPPTWEFGYAVELIKGDMRCDSEKKNADTDLGKESGEWRPVIPIPLSLYTPDSPRWDKNDTLVYPMAREVADTNKKAYVFPKTEVRGMMGDFQTGRVPRDADGSLYDLQFCLEYGAATESAPEDEQAKFVLKYRVVPAGSTIKDSQQYILSENIAIPKQKHESFVHTSFFTIPGTQIGDNRLVVIDEFYRDVSDVENDTYDGEVVIMGFKIAWDDNAAEGTSLLATFLNWPREHYQDGTHAGALLQSGAIILHETDTAPSGYACLKQLTEWVRLTTPHLSGGEFASDVTICGRRGAIAFQGGDNKFYYGFGIYGPMQEFNILGDLYEYDAVNKTWEEIAGETWPDPVCEAVAVSYYDDQWWGYFGTGFRSAIPHEVDTWYRFDCINETWLAKASYPEARDSAAAGIVISTEELNTRFIVVGAGEGGQGYNERYYGYRPDNNTWTDTGDIPDFPDGDVYGPAAFSIGSSMYVCGGFGPTVDDAHDATWMLSCTCVYDKQIGDYVYIWSWLQRASLPDVARGDAVAWSDETKGYVALGRNTDYGSLDSVMHYLPDENHWRVQPSFPGLPRSDAVAVTTDSEAFIIGGYNEDTMTFMGDFWELNRLYCHKKM